MVVRTRRGRPRTEPGENTGRGPGLDAHARTPGLSRTTSCRTIGMSKPWQARAGDRVRCPGRAAIEERKGGDRYRGRVYRRPWRRDRSGRGSAVTGTLVTQATAAERPASALAPSQDRTNQNQPDASTDTTLGRVQGRDFPTAGCARNADMPSATEDGGRRRCHAGRPTDRAVPSTRARSCRRCKPQPAPPVADRTGGWAWSAAGGTGP